MELARESVQPSPEEGETSEQSNLMDQQRDRAQAPGAESQPQSQQASQATPLPEKKAENGEPRRTSTNAGQEQPTTSSNQQESSTQLDQSSFSQMEAFLLLQIDRCAYYRNYFETQGDLPMTTKFDTLASLSAKDLEILRKVWRDEGKLPKFKFDVVSMNCVPMNCDVKEKQIEIVVKTSNVARSKDSLTYVIAEFDFPPAATGMTFSRWFLNFKLNPGRILCCRSEASNKQFDQIFSTGRKPFYNPQSELTEYDTALSFHVDKGKSKTLKRKYKPIRLEFYEKTGLFKCDKKVGIIHLNVDAISDEATIQTRLPIILGRKETGAHADITVRVREPLVDKKIRPHEEKILIVF